MFKLKIKSIVTLLFSLITITGLLAQPHTISGKVSSLDNEPLIGVTVIIKGTGNGVVTDADGNYSIRATKGQTLVFSHLEMGTKEVTLANESVINVSLEPSARAIEDVIVVAYGTAKKSSFTGSAETVSAEKIASRPVTDISKSLDGQVAGVMATSGSGQPGEGASLVVRGFGSINASNNPLIVVDGMPYDGTLNSINSNDIESITVLKDASAGALYGARGANGVVLIQTKSSRASEKVNVTFNLKTSVMSRAIPAYNTMSTKEYMETMYRACYNDLVYTEGYTPGAAALKTPDKVSSELLGRNEQYNPYKKSISSLYDANGRISSSEALRYDESWMDEVTRKVPVRQEYQAGVSGATNKAEYLASVSYMDEDGLLKTTNFSRFTGRVNLTVHPTKWFDAGINVNYSHTKTDFLGADESTSSNVWRSAQLIAPIYPVYEKDDKGNTIYKNGNKVFDYGSYRPAGAQNNKNCLATLYDDDYYNSSDNVNARTYVAFKWKWLKFTTNFGLDNSNENETTKLNRNNGDAAGMGRLTKEYARTMSYTWNQLLTYNQKFGRHSVDALVGHEFYGYRLDYKNAERTGFPFDDFDELVQGSTVTQAFTASENYFIDSYLSRVNYNFADRYYFSGSFRMDCSSRFHKKHRWGAFWSVGASWRISEEAFLKDVKWINNLVAKISYGVQGNDNVGSYYAWQSLYTLQYANANHSGAVISSLENSNVTWESNGNLNAGVSFRMFDRLFGEVEFFNRKTTNMLLEYPLAQSLGKEGYYANVGSMVNRGVDFTIGGDIIKTRDWNWTLSFMGSTLHNEILQLTGKEKQIVSNSFINREGGEINSFYMAKSAGVDPVTGSQLYYAYKKDTEGNRIAGSDYVTDDATVAANCKYVLGSRIPKMYGSISTQLRWKNLDLSILTTYSIGGKVFDMVYQAMMEPSFVGQNYHRNALRAWTSTGDVTDVPKITTNATTTTNDRYLVDASYFAIKNITLGYNITPHIKKGVENLRIYLSVDSPVIFTHLKGMDPQASFSGTTGYTYTPTRSVTIGIDLKL